MLTHTHTVHAHREVLLRKRPCSPVSAEWSKGNAFKHRNINTYTHLHTVVTACLQGSEDFSQDCVYINTVHYSYLEFKGHLISSVYRHGYNTANPVYCDKEHDLWGLKMFLVLQLKIQKHILIESKAGTNSYYFIVDSSVIIVLFIDYLFGLLITCSFLFILPFPHMQ